MIPRLPIGRGRFGLWAWTLIGTAALIAFVVLQACSSGSSPPAPPTETPPGTPPGDQPAGNCPPSLAQPDLAGNCRATPQATMGALEAVQ